MLVRWKDGLFDFTHLMLPAIGASFDEVLKAVLAAFVPHNENTFNVFNAFNYIPFDFPISPDRDGFEASQATTSPACTHTNNCWCAGTGCNGVREVV